MIIFCKQLCQRLEKQQLLWRWLLYHCAGWFYIRLLDWHQNLSAYVYIYSTFTCMSLDSVTLLMSTGLGLNAGSPSKDNWERWNVFSHVAQNIMSGCKNFNNLLGYTWLACDIRLDLLWRLAGAPSLILSMLQPQDNMVFKDSWTGQQYTSLSCNITNQRQSLAEMIIKLEL